MTSIRVSVCQHSLSSDIETNTGRTLKQMAVASKSKADVVLFPECNLTGYAGIEFTKYPSMDNGEINKALERIKENAAKLDILTIVGGYWFEDNLELPYNSLFVISSRGDEICRYDKRMLTAGESGDDIDFFTPGSEPVIFMLNGIKCGLLICHEWRYPELYREYKGLGVDIIFQSWYDANVERLAFLDSGKDHGTLILGAVRSNSANNYLWLCGSNASNPESSFGSFICRPDGKLVSNLARNRNGILIEDIDLAGNFIDPSKHNRDRFING